MVEDSQNLLWAKSFTRQGSLSAWIPGLSNLKAQGSLPPYTYPCLSNLLVSTKSRQLQHILKYLTNCKTTTPYAGFEGMLLYPCVEN